MNGDQARAALWTTSAKTRAPHVSQAEFFRAFPFRDRIMQGRLANALERAGF
jgi:hypothetical protein